jgi:hypothetical protein
LPSFATLFASDSPQVARHDQGKLVANFQAMACDFLVEMQGNDQPAKKL